MGPPSGLKRRAPLLLPGLYTVLCSEWPRLKSSDGHPGVGSFIQRLELRKGLVSDRYCWRLSRGESREVGDAAGGRVGQSKNIVWGGVAWRGGTVRFDCFFLVFIFPPRR